MPTYIDIDDNRARLHFPYEKDRLYLAPPARLPPDTYVQFFAHHQTIPGTMVPTHAVIPGVLVIPVRLLQNGDGTATDRIIAAPWCSPKLALNLGRSISAHVKMQARRSARRKAKKANFVRAERAKHLANYIAGLIEICPLFAYDHWCQHQLRIALQPRLLQYRNSAVVHDHIAAEAQRAVKDGLIKSPGRKRDLSVEHQLDVAREWMALTSSGLSHERAAEEISGHEARQGADYLGRVGGPLARLVFEGKQPPASVAKRFIGTAHHLPLAFLFIQDGWLALVQGSIKAEFDLWLQGPGGRAKARVLAGGDEDLLLSAEMP